MSNSTDVIITCFGEELIVDKIGAVIGLNFRQVSNGYECGGDKISIFESFACSQTGVDKRTTERLIRTFFEADWIFPESCSMIICCDDNEELDGTYVPFSDKPPIVGEQQ